jgi:CelD/BcsL family acetyltransferase involved in cellulose biosynthesis
MSVNLAVQPADGFSSAVGPSRFVVETASDWGAIGAQWEGACTPFQDPIWLESWYGSFWDRPGLTLLLVTARDRATGEIAVRLPLVLQRQGRIRTIAFADLDLTDYNAPLLGPAVPSDAATMHALWLDILRALPAADIIRLAKMPALLRGRPNPLAFLPQAVPSAVNGNVVETGDDWDVWRRSLHKTVRKELERSWRVFERHDGARFEIVTDQAEAQRCIGLASV